MLKIFISAYIAAATIYLTPVAFAEEGGVSTNPAIEVAFWNSVKDSRDPSELQAYLNKYPKGQFAELAVIRKQNLEKFKTSSGSVERNQLSKIANSEMKPSTAGIDPRFDQYITELKSELSAKRRPDIGRIFPVLFPVSAANSVKVTAAAGQIFKAPFPSAGAISIGPTGKAVLGMSRLFYHSGGPENAALSECESYRRGSEAVLPKCEIFVSSRTIDSKVLIRMAEQARGPDFDAWTKGLNESVSAWKK